MPHFRTSVALWGHRGCLYEVWEVDGGPMDVIGGRLYEVCEVLRRFWMIEGLI